MKKITVATLKSFIKKNKSNLLIKVKSTFDGMQDCVVATGNGFSKASATVGFLDNTLGINGVWIVRGSRDHVQPYSDDAVEGLEVYNCCGSFIVAVEKSQASALVNA